MPLGTPEPFVLSFFCSCNRDDDTKISSMRNIQIQDSGSSC